MCWSWMEIFTLILFFALQWARTEKFSLDFSTVWLSLFIDFDNFLVNYVRVVEFLFDLATSDDFCWIVLLGICVTTIGLERFDVFFTLFIKFTLFFYDNFG